MYNGYNDTNGKFPNLTCVYSDDVNYCDDVYVLPRSILSPRFHNAETICYMYSPPKDKLNYIHEGAYLHFGHSGYLTNFSEHTVHIQIYEPTKNPNRAVYDISPFPHQYSAEYLDNWIDTQLLNEFILGTESQMVTVNGLPGIGIHFKIIYTKKIDPDSLWNLVGVFPKYLMLSELSITNTEIFGSQRTTGSFKEIKIYPSDKKKTVITEKRDVTIISTLGIIGGMISMLMSVKVLLFGARPTEPWGVFQRLSLRSNREQSKSKNLKKYFLIPGVDNVPFVTPVHQRFSDIYAKNDDRNSTMIGNSSSVDTETDTLIDSGSGSMQIRRSDMTTDHQKEMTDLIYAYGHIQERLEQLEGRNQILELVLKACYIDDRIFREIHETAKTKQRRSSSDTETTTLAEKKLSIDGNEIN
ncbi:hypothetical protein INT47_000103 [Mucor saturninus]|uniref:Uncharacterized protein n=1 Tax=Mucor saturninus TaxID=64648 RepID=A0A8H7RJT8_9FUNG|nr:hypothetical protein INT47_000103 [Mucor saturninus]